MTAGFARPPPGPIPGQRRETSPPLRGGVEELVGSSGESERDRRRDSHDFLIFGLDQLPSALVHHPMVPATEQDEIAEVGRTAMDPVHEVMSIAPGRRALTTGPAAVTVANPEGPAQGVGDHALAAADVDGHRVLAEQDPGDAAVASHALH